MFFEIFESLPGSLQNEFKKRKKNKKIKKSLLKMLI
jgi:hypothetical protein